MIKRLCLSLLIVILFIVFIPFEKVIASNQHTSQPPYEVKEEILDQNTREYTIKFPEDASMVLYQADTYSYTGKGKIIQFAPDREKREIKVVIQGESNAGTVDVKGYSSERKVKLRSNPGNAMCRYSDGIDWQVATYNLNDGVLTQKRYSSSLPETKGASIPPTNIPYGKINNITTFVQPEINVAATVWLDSNDNVIPSNKIDYSTVVLPKNQIYPIIGTPAFIKNQSYDEKKPEIGVQYTPTERPLDPLRDIKTDNPAFLTGHAICKMYPVTIEYVLSAKAKLTGYSYGGNITFQYITLDEPAIIGELIADPNSVKFTDKDIKVKVTLNAEVVNLTKPGVLRDYRIYLRTEDGSQSAPMIKVSANGKTNVSGSYEFTIPKEAMAGKEDITQVFNGRATVDFKTGELYKGQLNTGLLSANTYVYKNPPKPPEPEVPKPQLIPPVAVIDGASEVKLGDYIPFHGFYSYDPDGTIEAYRWKMPGARQPNIELDKYDLNYGEVQAWYDKLGPQQVLLYVKDNDGLQAGTYYSFNVIEPTVEAGINQTGTLKENRKVTFTENSDSPVKYPVINEKTRWTIESEDGNLNDQIKYAGSLNRKKSIDVLFKKAGRYKVTLSVENTAGYTSTVTRIYTIKPDEAPYVNFEFQRKIYRDPEKGNIATFTLKDRSYSYDGDTIAKRNWYVIFDANNDGVFNEPRVLFATGNETEVEYEAASVGQYRFLLEVQEEFGQPTIDAFVTSNDRKKANTWQ
ncbi:hypothetical protein ACFP56_21605 [Paenibacillus septentrionalis]|uniref:PKD domain-containing protein n=1 Tax=Paenibacillus septentrionalis TaxID=429342 RepID=A0ABW1VCB5_9BACL